MILMFSVGNITELTPSEWLKFQQEFIHDLKRANESWCKFFADRFVMPQKTLQRSEQMV